MEIGVLSMEKFIVTCNLHKICQDQGITIRDLAKKTGISETQLYIVANQGGNMRLDNIARLIVTLDCNFDDLFTIKRW